MTTIKIQKKRQPWLLLLLVMGLIGLTLASVAWAWTKGLSRVASLKQDAPILLPVPAIAQSQGTSCGEAVIVMAYNYVHPESLLNEGDVIAYAAENGYFTEQMEPFTSPSNMLKITGRYTSDYSSGTVFTANQGLALLIRSLQKGEPVIIDSQTHLDDLNPGAHFVLVTGIARDPNDPSVITIYFNNPQSGLNEAAPWAGQTGIWHAWQNNPDPGGYGWWLVISTQ